MEIRSFLAFELPADIMNILLRVARDLRKTPLGVRWVRETNIHLTMIFLGDIRTEDIEAIKSKTEALAQSSMKLGEAMYQASQSAEAPTGDGAEPGTDSTSAAGGDDVVDADFEEVKDDDSKRSA